MIRWHEKGEGRDAVFIFQATAHCFSNEGKKGT